MISCSETDLLFTGIPKVLIDLAFRFIPEIRSRESEFLDICLGCKPEPVEAGR